MLTLRLFRNLLAVSLLTCAAALNALGQSEQAPASTPASKSVNKNMAKLLASIANDSSGCVFEGEVMRSYFYENADCEVYSCEVKVTNVFKGSIKIGTIEVLKCFHKHWKCQGSLQHAQNGIFYAKLRSDYPSTIPKLDSTWAHFDNEKIAAGWLLFEFQTASVRIEAGRYGIASFNTRNEFLDWFRAQDYVSVPPAYDVNRLPSGKFVWPINLPSTDE